MRPHRVHPRRPAPDRFAGGAARDVGGRGLTIRLRDGVAPDHVAVVRDVPGVRGADASDGILHVGADEPETVAPEVVRALVANGADIVELRPERPSLERIYFEVMGVRPGAEALEDQA